MTPLLFVLISVAGGLGSAVRFVVDGFVRRHALAGFPWATAAINVSGSLVLGFVTAMMVAQLLPNAAGMVVGTGFLGGYTTFSTASYETVQLLRQRRFGAAAASGVGMLLLSVGAAGLGLWAGAAVASGG